jgi:hypothetical protein
MPAEAAAGVVALGLRLAKDLSLCSLTTRRKGILSCASHVAL